jgi:hypothetical protein
MGAGGVHPRRQRERSTRLPLSKTVARERGAARGSMPFRRAWSQLAIFWWPSSPAAIPVTDRDRCGLWLA